MNSLFRFALLFLLSGIFTSGCTPPLGVSPEARTEIGDEVIEQLFDRLRENDRMFQSLQGVAKVQVSWNGKTSNLTQVLQVVKPDLFRAETLNPFGFGTPLLLMAADGRELAVMIPGEGRLLRGEASSQNLQRFTRLPLQLPDLVSFLLYQVPLIPSPHRHGTVGPVGDYRLELRAFDGRRQELLFRSDMQLLEVAYYRNEELTLRVRYDKFSVGPTPFPQLATMSMPPQQAEASLTFTEISTNIILAPDLFRLMTPPGYEERSFP